jgi:hypothetical protein
MNALFAISAIELGGFSKAALFAAPGDIITIITIVIFIGVPLLGHLLSKMKEPQAPNRPARPARPPQQSVQNEIEDFLRRANDKKGTPPANRPRPSQPAPKAKPVEKPPRAQEVVKAEVVRERPVGGGVEKHVKQFMNKEGFERRSKQLGEEVAETDEKVERHLKSVFDHSLSKIAATPGVSASAANVKMADTAPELTLATPSVAAGDVAALLGDPLSIRQAIILSEILNRPIDRWERETRG